MSELAESLLVLSDVHLGSDVNDLSSHGARRSTEVDRDLVRLLEHYRLEPPRGRRWRLIVAGDFIDLIGMTVAPVGLSLDTPPTPEEYACGLGNAADHTCEKLRRVASRHPEVFAALAAFVDAGHAVTFVHGNHDLELHWPVVRDELLRLLLAHRASGTGAAEFAGRIEHDPWFYYIHGAVYVEHGHQYDPFCSTDHPMVPLSPRDKRRLSRGFCDVLLRQVVRPTRGLSEHGHETLGVVDYFKLGVRLGLRGMLRLGARYLLAVRELFRLWWEHRSKAAQELRAEHGRRIARFAKARRIELGRLRALLALQTRPITSTIAGCLASLLVDRLVLALVALGTLLTLCLVGLGLSHLAIAAAGVIAAWVGANWLLVRLRTVSADERLQKRAGELAKLFPTAFVVMGHTHTPTAVAVDASATYVNVGSWSEDDGAARAARTHLVIHPEASGPRGELRFWDSSLGPSPFRAPVADR